MVSLHRVEAAVARGLHPGGTVTGRRIDQLAAFQFEVEFDDHEPAATFSECSGLEMSVKFEEVREGGLNEYVHKLPGRVEYGNLVLKHGYVPMPGTASGEGKSSFFDWCLSAFNRANNTVKRRNVTVKLVRHGDSNIIFAWTFRDAFPVKWSGPSLRAGDSSIAIESIELAHRGIQDR